MGHPTALPDFSRAADWVKDPKHLVFVLSRYKFVSKMLEGTRRVLEVGAGDGIASEIVRRSVCELVCTDIQEKPGVALHDILAGPLFENFDAAYSLDVIEHIHTFAMPVFLSNIRKSLGERGVCIIGSPSMESQAYASEMSVQYHVNCMPAKKLRAAMLEHFDPVFMFGMNDEVVHTGFDAMRHYNFAVGVK